MDHVVEGFQYESWCATCARVMDHAAGQCLGCGLPDDSVGPLQVASGDAVGAHVSKPQFPSQNHARTTGARGMDGAVQHPNSWGENR